MPGCIGHGKSGSHTALEMEKMSPTIVHRTADADRDVVRKMVSRYGDDVIARVLRSQATDRKGQALEQFVVKTARCSHSIDGCPRFLVDADVLTLQGAAGCTKMSDTTITKLVEGGILPMHQVVPLAPRGICRTDLDRERARNAIARLKHTGRLVLGDTSATQSELFL